MAKIKKKKGFTLIELIATITILLAIFLIISPLVINKISEGKVALSDQTKQNIVLAGKNWANDNKKLLPENGETKAVYIEYLQQNGYLYEDIKDIKTGENIEGCVVIKNINNVYYYEYSNDNNVCPAFSIQKKLTLDSKTNKGDTEDKTLFVEPNEEVDLTKYSAEKKEWDFVGWSYKNDTDKPSDVVSSITMPDKDLTLYAIYRYIGDTYRLTTDANGGNGTVNTASCTESAWNAEPTPTSCTAVLPQNGFTRTHYTFNGWSLNKDDKSGLKPGDKVTLSSDTTYYATWKVNTYTLTYDYKTNGGSSVEVSSKEYEPTDVVDLSVKASKSGWTFVGWNTNKNATTGFTNFQMPWEDETLYAIYKKTGTSYRITTNANGGSGTVNTSSCTTATVYNNQTPPTSCTAVLPQNGFTKSGYDFNGWSTSSSASSGSNPGTTVTLSSNKTYYATWKKQSKTYTANFYINGTFRYQRECTTTGSSCYITAPSPSSSYIPSGYTFDGWGTSSTSTSALYDAYDSISLSSSRNFYAVLDKKPVSKTYYAYFYVNGSYKYSKSCTTTGSSCSVTLSTPSSSYIPSGYSFKGWSTSSSASTVNYNGGTSVYISSNKSYYAVLNKNVASDTRAPKVWVEIIGNGSGVANGTGTVSASGWYKNITLNIVAADYVNGSDASSGYGSGFSSNRYSVSYESGSDTRYGMLTDNNKRLSASFAVTSGGSRTVRISVTDASGNTGSVTAKFNLDNQAPSLWSELFNGTWGRCVSSDAHSGVSGYGWGAYGNYTYTRVGSGCAYPGTRPIDVNSRWNEGFDFAFWCGNGSSVYWTCSAACDNAGNCSGSHTSRTYSW